MDVSILHKDGYRVPILLRTNPIRNSHGAVVGATESFEKNRSASEWTRRQAGFADFGCLDSVTGVAAQSFMETLLRENLVTFAEHHIPLWDAPRPNRSHGSVPGEAEAQAWCPQFYAYCAVSGELCADRSSRVQGQESIIAILLECKESEVAPGRGAGPKND